MLETEILRLKFLTQGQIFVDWVDRRGFECWFYTFDLKTGLYDFWRKTGKEVSREFSGLTRNRAGFMFNILMHEDVEEEED